MLLRYFLVLSLLIVNFPSQADTPLEGFIERLNQLSSMEATFEQRTYDKQGRVLQSLGGLLSVAKPGKMRWQTNPPYEQLVVSDGESVWIYDMDLEQVTIRNLERRLQDTPALLLSGNTEEISQNFDVKQEALPQNSTRYLLTPFDVSQLFSLIEFDYKGDTLELMRIRDAVGQVTEITFSNQKINPEIDNQGFVFDIPDDVDVIDGRNGF